MKNKKTNLGMLAHVDAGKTTLIESLLYTSGMINKVGRVDHKDAYLDTHEIERKRGITVFSKQAELQWKDRTYTIMDTPGHVDFSTEMERTLRVLDYAVLLISGSDGLQGHVFTLWRLLKKYKIPTFLFVNKMDQANMVRDEIMEELRNNLDANCIDFSPEYIKNYNDDWNEEIAITAERLLEAYMEQDVLSDEEIGWAIKQRKIFPCFFGSALKHQGIEEVLDALDKYVTSYEGGEVFGANVFKIMRDAQGNRLTYLKITSGSLKVKDLVKTDDWEEKVNQIRIYSGISYDAVQEVGVGTICAVTGLNHTKCGQGLGCESDWELPVLEPILTYSVHLENSDNLYEFYNELMQLEEEEPELHVIRSVNQDDIKVQVMGEIQIEILQNILWERFGREVRFGEEQIVYKETIKGEVIGIGHFEPLRHYAEVHLFIEEGERGSGFVIENECFEDILERNWQNAVLHHLREKQHIGVLTGSALSDIEVTLVAGRGHEKHTEGGDFRQATYRALRQGLMQAESILLEPTYRFVMEIPNENTGRALNDIQKMSGSFENPEIGEEKTLIRGVAPVATMRGYQREFISYTKGYGRLSLELGDYLPCHNQEVVVKEFGYIPEADVENPADSIFCSHGAGYQVAWSEVKAHAHVEDGYMKRILDDIQQVDDFFLQGKSQRSETTERFISHEEIEEIMGRTYRTSDSSTQKYRKKTRVITSPSTYTSSMKSSYKQEKYLLVDGYNIIFSWPELKELANVNIEGARGKLLDVLCNYQGYRKEHVIVVFDGYKVKGNIGTVQDYHNIKVIYTKEAETADAYIEKTVPQLVKSYQVTVATSDAMEQMIIMGQGAQRMSAMELLRAIEEMKKEIETEYLEKRSVDKTGEIADKISKIDLRNS